MQEADPIDGPRAHADRPVRPAANAIEDTPAVPKAYFLTFRTYGTWLHSDERGAVDRHRSDPGDPFVPPAPSLEAYERSLLTEDPVLFDDRARAIVEATIREVCAYRGWALHAVNVRTNHAHIVLTAGAPPEQVMNNLKGWATRRLADSGAFPRGPRPWARHGSTQYLWTEQAVGEACEYVINGQGGDISGAARRSG